MMPVKTKKASGVLKELLDNMNPEDLEKTRIEMEAESYSYNKVMERDEYEKYSIETRKELTSFDGYDLEQAFEDGVKWYKAYLEERSNK